MAPSSALSSHNDPTVVAMLASIQSHQFSPAQSTSQVFKQFYKNIKSAQHSAIDIFYGTIDQEMWPMSYYNPSLEGAECGWQLEWLCQYPALVTSIVGGPQCKESR